MFVFVVDFPISHTETTFSGLVDRGVNTSRQLQFWKCSHPVPLYLCLLQLLVVVMFRMTTAHTPHLATRVSQVAEKPSPKYFNPNIKY